MSAPSAAAVSSTAPSLAGGAVDMMLSLILVLALLFALAWLLRRVQTLRGSRAGALRVHAGLPLGTREKVVWLEAGGKHFLLGVTPQGINLIHAYAQAPELPETNAEAPVVPPLAGAFADRLREALGRKSP